MGILIKDVVYKCDGKSNLQHIKNKMDELEDGEYAIYICNKSKAKTLPQLKYFFGVVLRKISDYTGYTADELYYYFEDLFVPSKVVEIDGKEIIIKKFKDLSSKEAGDVIEKVIHFANEKFGLEFESREGLKDSDAEELYVGAYNDQWKDYKTNI